MKSPTRSILGSIYGIALAVLLVQMTVAAPVTKPNTTFILADDLGDWKENTLVVFISDDGPVAKGSAGALGGGKYVTMDDGHRVPGIFRWPGQIPAGQVSDATISSLDLLPLCCNVAGVTLPTDRKIDGKKIIDILQGQKKETPREALSI